MRTDAGGTTDEKAAKVWLRGWWRAQKLGSTVPQVLDVIRRTDRDYPYRLASQRGTILQVALKCYKLGRRRGGSHTRRANGMDRG